MTDSKSIITAQDAKEFLESNGWRHYKNSRREWAYACMFKKFETKTLCNLNRDKSGINVEIALYDNEYLNHKDSKYSTEFYLAGELKDETWVEIHQWGLPQNDVKHLLTLIPRLLSTWEHIANY